MGSTERPLSVIRKGYSLVPMGRAAVLHDAQAAGGDLVAHAMVEQDHAIGHVFLQAMPRHHLRAALAGDHRRKAAILDPAEEPPQFGAQHRSLGRAAKSASSVSSTRRFARSSSPRDPGG
jgi:hypothetical protein